MKTSKVKPKIVHKVIRCVVAGKNFDTDENDFVFLKVRTPLNKSGTYNRGKLNASAKSLVSTYFNFQSKTVFTQDDLAFSAFRRDAFIWKSATIFSI